MNFLKKPSTIILASFIAIFSLIVSNAVLVTAAMAKETSSPLGDLSGFEKIGKDVFKFVEIKDFEAAKTKITELETAWDRAEESLRAKDGKAWRFVDKSIDKALAKVRANKPDPDECKEALKEMYIQMESPGLGKK